MWQKVLMLVGIGIFASGVFHSVGEFASQTHWAPDGQLAGLGAAIFALGYLNRNKNYGIPGRLRRLFHLRSESQGENQ